jgi:hypothetical protein
MAYVEKFYPSDDAWGYQWDEIETVIGQLVHNTTHRFEDDPELASGQALYYPPSKIVDLRPGQLT